jgi:hypothetical protein
MTEAEKHASALDRFKCVAVTVLEEYGGGKGAHEPCVLRVAGSGSAEGFVWSNGAKFSWVHAAM